MKSFKVIAVIAIVLLSATCLKAGDKKQAIGQQVQAELASAKQVVQQMRPNIQPLTDEEAENGFTISSGDIQITGKLSKAENIVGMPHQMNGENHPRWYGVARTMQYKVSCTSNKCWKFKVASEEVKVLDEPTVDFRNNHKVPPVWKTHAELRGGAWVDQLAMGGDNQPQPETFFHLSSQDVFIDGQKIATMYLFQTAHDIYLLGYVTYYVAPTEVLTADNR